MNEIFSVAQRLRDEPDRRAALATVVEARGSTYRRPGARLLVFDDGETVGSISGGCLESDLIDHSKRVISSCDSMLLRHRPTDEDILMGTGLGCDGELLIVIEPIRDALRKELQDLRDSGSARFMITNYEDASTAATRVSESRPDSTRGCVFVHELVPRLHLVILGGAPEAPSLARIGKTLGWRVTIADHRAAWATRARFGDVDAIVVEPVGSLVSRAIGEERCAVVVMTHNLLHDVEILRNLADKELAYLGVIGPSRRKERLIAALAREGVEIDRTSLRGPAGIDLGAETPEEIALSIASEIQAVVRGGRGGFLRDRPGPIHRTTQPIVANPDVAVVLLAAGGSSRLGRPKQLLRVDGESLLERSVDAALGCAPVGVFVVVGAEEEKMREELEGRPVRIIGNPNWRDGMSASIRAGVGRVIEELPDFRGIVLMVCDQPGVSSAHLAALIRTWRESGRNAAATRYPEGPGVPALLDRGFSDELRSLEGDAGARELLRARRDSIVEVDLADPSDIDTIEDLARSPSCSPDSQR